MFRQVGPIELLIVLVLCGLPVFGVAAAAAAVLAGKRIRGPLIKCPYCAEFIKAEAKVCRYCGRDIAQPTE